MAASKRDLIIRDMSALKKIELDAIKRINLYVKALKNTAQKKITRAENVVFLKNFHAKIDVEWEKIRKRAFTINMEIEEVNLLLRKGKNIEFVERKRVILNNIGEIEARLRMLYREVMDVLGRIPEEKGFMNDVEVEIVKLIHVFERDGVDVAGLA